MYGVWVSMCIWYLVVFYVHRAHSMKNENVRIDVHVSIEMPLLFMTKNKRPRLCKEFEYFIDEK